MKKVVLISGCSSGLGKILTEDLSKDLVVYAGARNPGEVEESRNIKPVKLDITNEEDCKDAVERIVEKEGRIDVLINNAGYTLVGSTTDFKADEFLKILDTNIVGAFRLIKYAVPYMKKQRGGRIINITSLNGIISLPNFGLYSSSKHGLNALGISLRYELQKYGIWVTNLAPGAIASESKTTKSLPHKPAREKFRILSVLMPMLTKRDITEKVREIIDSYHPPAQVIMGADAKITTFLKRFFPSFVWDYLMNFVWSKK